MPKDLAKATKSGNKMMEDAELKLAKPADEIFLKNVNFFLF